MLQIRLSKGGGGSSGDGGGVPGGKSAATVETVTVACPDHLVLADLPVAKSLGAVTASAVRSLGRRSRRHLGERVHFCVRCDFPIAIYGRIALRHPILQIFSIELKDFGASLLDYRSFNSETSDFIYLGNGLGGAHSDHEDYYYMMPCEHAFCLACARSDISCYLCDERILKIQTIKVMEDIYICAAPHCLKSFLKRAEFEAHVHETHADLIHTNIEKEGGNENNAISTTRPSSTDAQKQSQQPEVSTARAPSKPGFSPISNSQHQDQEEMIRHHQSRDPPPRPPLQPKPPPFQSQQPAQSSNSQSENTQQGFERPHGWFPQPPTGSPFQQNPDQFSADKAASSTPENPFSNFPQLPHQLLNFSVPLNANQSLVPTPPLPFAPFPTDGSQPYYVVPPEMPQPDSAKERGSEQGSVLGVPPPPPLAIGGFPDNSSRPWAGMGFMGAHFQPLQIGQGFPEGFAYPMDPQAGVAFFQGDFGQTGMSMNPNLPVKESEQVGGLALQPPSVAPPLPFLPPPPMPP